jgi:hypothetical protein
MDGRRAWALVLAVPLFLLGCEAPRFDPKKAAVGPGGMVGESGPVSSGEFEGGNDVLPPPRTVAVTPDDIRPPDCDGNCVSYCDAAGLKNPVNRGLCRSLWGVGIAPRPVNGEEACRRIYIDLQGRIPTADEASACAGDFGGTVRGMIDTDAFVAVNQRRFADRFLYSTQVVSVQAILDMDRLVGRMLRGTVSYDQFASIAASHPVITRRHADPRDIAEAVFRQFMGRPPFENERADLSRLYAVWHPGYYDHPTLNLRLPDAFVRYPCRNEEGVLDPDRLGECTSVLWGHNELVLEPDLRAAHDPQARGLTMWGGLLTAAEWEKLQLPGRILSSDLAFWERAVDDVLEQYLGYELSAKVPEVREELVKHLLAHNGDLRAVHHAVATSVAYLQSNAGASSKSYRWTYGPLKQVEAEVWIDSLSAITGYDPGACDYKITHPDALLEAGSISAYKLLRDSTWRLDGEGQLETRYADLARTLGGCPENVIGGRFKVTSILTTTTQLAFVGELCNPAMTRDAGGAPIESLLPSAVVPTQSVDTTTAGEIAAHQYRTLVGRTPTTEELGEARAAGEQCALTRCNAEQMARPMCFALLSSAELLFY